ncbi:hypothetical protein SELMODRAFT_430982 [Selaginella moellendorffii]|uniref:Uncharacterized protein n=1 Tax=Selaginella moellendorffii TaxID=88036 RepID=D8TB53_SELML|nr:hypothetical protein SELMODRAFT_430982 [Selaginella moellendorffii]
MARLKIEPTTTTSLILARPAAIIKIMAGLTSLAARIRILARLTSPTARIRILAGLTSPTARMKILVELEALALEASTSPVPAIPTVRAMLPPYFVPNSATLAIGCHGTTDRVSASKMDEELAKCPMESFLAFEIGGGFKVSLILLFAETAIRRRCDNYISFKREAIEQFAVDESGYKARFPSARTLVYSLGGRPCILWEGVGSGLVELDTRFAGRLSSQQVTVVLAPSGSGKTRMLIELASTRFSLFFTGDRPMVGFGGGSKDIHRVANWMENSFPRGERNITPEHPVVLCGVGALILARLSFFKLLKECKPGLVPRDWAFFQLEYPAVDDVFLGLLEVLLGLVRDVHQVPTFVNYFTSSIEKLVKEVGWGDATVVLDEAQSLLQCMKGRFISGRTPQEGQSLLNPIVLALKSYGVLQSPLFVSEIYSLPGFDGSNIQAFMERFIDVSRLDMLAVISTYTGRRRILSTAIEQYIMETAPTADWFMEFARRMVTETGRELGVQRSLGDDAARQQELRDIVIFTFTFSGARHVIVPGRRRAMTLVDWGFATLLEGSDGAEPFAPIVPYIRGVADNEAQAPGLRVTTETRRLSVTTEIRYVILQEPLVVDALWHHMSQGMHMGYFLNAFRQRVINFETYVCWELGRAFEKKVPAEVLGLVETHTTYKETYELLKQRGASEGAVTVIENAEQLNEWLKSVETSVSFATYGWIGQFCEAGPDAMFFLWNGKLNKIMPVFVQIKTGSDLGATQAFATLDIMKLDKKVNSEGSHKLKEWCSTGYIRFCPCWLKLKQTLHVGVTLISLSKRPAIAQLAVDESGDCAMVGFGGGSKDIHRVANWMENSFLGGERNITPEHPVVLCGVGVARLTWLKFLKECTGMSLLTVWENLLSGTMKPFDMGEIYSLPGFDGSNIQAFMKRWELGVHPSLRDDVVLLWNNPETASFIEDLIFTYYLSGAGYVRRRGITFVDCGLAPDAIEYTYRMFYEHI